MLPWRGFSAYDELMETVVRNIDDIDVREALEHLLGRRLAEHQQLVIQILNRPVSVTDNAPLTVAPLYPALPDWCDVYRGLSDEEVDEIEKTIVRSPGGRTFD